MSVFFKILFKNIVVTFLFVCSIIIPSAFAQTKVGVVNVQRMMAESKAAIEATKKLEQEFSGRDQEMQKLSRQLQTMQDAFEKNSATMSDTEKRRKENEFAELTRDFQRKGRELREDLERRRSEETSKLLERAQAIINKIAETDKFDLIIRDAIYVSPTSDITDRVIKTLD